MLRLLMTNQVSLIFTVQIIISMSSSYSISTFTYTIHQQLQWIYTSDSDNLNALFIPKPDTPITFMFIYYLEYLRTYRWLLIV